MSKLSLHVRFLGFRPGGENREPVVFYDWLLVALFAMGELKFYYAGGPPGY